MWVEWAPASGESGESQVLAVGSEHRHGAFAVVGWDTGIGGHSSQSGQIGTSHDP